MMKNPKNNKDQKNPVLVPTIILKSLNGKQTKFTIPNEKFLIGRLSDLNDIALQPDPQNLVTRHMHCFVEIRNSTGWLIDNASKNGTFLKRNNSMQKINGEIKLQDDDCIMILGEIKDRGAVTISELSKNFNVSEMTIRRDLNLLEEKGFIKRTHLPKIQ